MNSLISDTLAVLIKALFIRPMKGKNYDYARQPIHGY
jgi:hypothetical protein